MCMGNPGHTSWWCVFFVVVVFFFSQFHYFIQYSFDSGVGMSFFHNLLITFLKYKKMYIDSLKMRFGDYMYLLK